MRPRSFDDDAATQTATSDLLRRFDALQDPAAATTTAATAAVIFTGPIETTFLVAASDARAEIKAVADYICDGTADQAEINAAWLAVQSLNIGGGKVVLSAGTFTMSDGVTVNPDQGEPGVMVGAGRGATLIHMASGSFTSAVRVRAGSTVRDFSILVDGSATVSRGALEIDEGDSAAFSISIDTDDGVGIWCDGARNRVESCDILTRTDATHAIHVAENGDETMIVNNVIHECRQNGIQIDADVGGSPVLVQILGNKIRNPSRQTADTYDGIHMSGPFATQHGPTIVGNVIWKTGGSDFRDGINIEVANVIDVTVVGNTVGAGVGRWAIVMNGVRSLAEANHLMGGIDVGGDDNHIVGNHIAIINDASNGIVVAGDRNSIFNNKVFPQSGSDPAVGIEVQAGANDNVIGLNDLEQTGTKFTDAGTNTVELAAGASTPLTTKGDIHGFTTIDARLAVGTNGQVIVADSGEGVGIKWDDLGVWTTWSPSYTNLTIGNGTVVARYRPAKHGDDTIIAVFELLFGSATTIDGGNPTISTPVTAASSYTTPRHHIGPAYIQDTGSLARPGMVRLESTTTFSVSVFDASATYLSNASITATIPMTWTTGDLLSFTATFEAA